MIETDVPVLYRRIKQLENDIQDLEVQLKTYRMQLKSFKHIFENGLEKIEIAEEVWRD